MAPTSVLITGCTKGSLGDHLAREFARLGCRVYASARRIESMGDLGEVSSLVTLLALDITDPASVTAARDLISAETGGTLDILYHNAGYRSISMAIDLGADSDIHKIMNVNFTSVVVATQIFAPLVIAAKGKIVFTGSGSGRAPQPADAAYCSSKAALDMYSQVLRFEMNPLGVQVILVNTGNVKTGVMRLERITLPKESPYAHLESIFNAAWDKYAKSATDPNKYARYVVGKVLQKTAPEVIWSGGTLTALWLIETLTLRWIFPIVIPPVFGLNKPITRE